MVPALWLGTSPVLGGPVEDVVYTPVIIGFKTLQAASVVLANARICHLKKLMLRDRPIAHPLRDVFRLRDIMLVGEFRVLRVQSLLILFRIVKALLFLLHVIGERLTQGKALLMLFLGELILRGPFF